MTEQSAEILSNPPLQCCVSTNVDPVAPPRLLRVWGVGVGPSAVLRVYQCRSRGPAEVVACLEELVLVGPSLVVVRLAIS